MGGELHRTQAQGVHAADDGGVAVEIEAALYVEHSGDLALGVDALDVGGGAREFDRLGVARDLLHGGIQHANRLLGLQARGVVVFRDEDGKEEGADAALTRSHEVELPVRLADADIAAVVELAVDGMNMAVEDERALVKFESTVGDRGRGNGLRTQYRNQRGKSREDSGGSIIIEA